MKILWEYVSASDVARMVLDIMDNDLKMNEYLHTTDDSRVFLIYQPFPQKVMWT